MSVPKIALRHRIGTKNREMTREGWLVERKNLHQQLSGMTKFSEGFSTLWIMLPAAAFVVQL